MPTRALDLSTGIAPGDELARTVEHLCTPGVITAVAQPIVRPADRLVVGYEALARMPVEPVRPPDWWLARADELGLRTELEIACLAAAANLGPTPDNQLLFVNTSPSTLAEPAALALVGTFPARVVIELTEQEAVIDYEQLRMHLARWLSLGFQVAVDDAGAGYSSLRHVIELAPDFLKLDRELIRGIHQDRTRLALVRSVLAFAREVGTSVIAEGVETSDELKVLRKAGVNLVQGYLLARPGPPWPAISVTGARLAAVADLVSGPNVQSLKEALARANDSQSACSAVVEYLFRQSEIMPSVYLARHGELRCVAQRGLWHVLDGMPASVGITGRTWKTGKPIVAEDVSSSPDYVQAIPGVVAEMCVPIGTGAAAIGALNVDSLVPLPRATLPLLEYCAELLAARLEEIGSTVDDSAWHRAVRASVAISGVTEGPHTPMMLLRSLRDAALLDSAALIFDGPEHRSVTAAIGPLGRSLSRLKGEEIEALCRLVGDIRSCYTAGDASDRTFAGTESLRSGGARAVVILPLWARHRRLGTIVLAHSKPVHLSCEDIAPLEMLSDHIASVLVSPPASP